MPFSIWVTRAPTYAQAHREAVGNLKAPLTTPPGEAGLDRAELDDLLHVLGATAHPADHARWLRYAKTGEPWCSVFTTPFEGPLRHVELSASYSNPRFMRNMLDMFDLGLRLAERLGGKLYEETQGAEITAANIDAFLAHEGEFVKGQHAFWRSGQEQLWSSSYAPLEYPLGAIDQLSDYLQFGVATKGEPPPLSALVAKLPEHLEAHPLQHSAVLEDRKSGAPVVRLIRVEDGVIVRPYWSHLAFEHLARETFRAVERAEALTGGEVRYLGKPASATSRKELEAHAKGLGVEYYEWLNSPRA